MLQSPFLAIPEELRLLPQWVVWKYEDIGAKKPTKVPYNPKNGKHADVTDSNTWSSFEEAFNYFSMGNCSGLGFVFSKNDPYAFIDLDDTEGDNAAYDRQVKIFKEFDSYSELSPSGKGLHIIIKGNVSAGRRRSHIEIYSENRYATMTGNVHNIKPIQNRQEILSQLWEQMGGTINNINHIGDAPETATDQEIITRALNASNGEKFEKLLNGKWQDIYASQSEADYAFIDIIAFYTQNKIQISRIFRASPLGQRLKAKRVDYVDRMILRSFDKMLPPIDFDGFKNALEEHLNKGRVAQRLEPAAHNGLVTGSNPVAPTNSPLAQSVEHCTLTAKVEGSNPSGVAIPPGLLGEIAQFIYNAAPRPVPEIALVGAIGLMAGICGKAYNVSNTGLNQYILLLAKTGMGKEGMAQGIDKLMNTVQMQVPTAHEFIGPSYIASGQALVKYVHKASNCFVSILGEFGLRLQAMSSFNANPHDKIFKQVLLELYNKSGHSDFYRASIHADMDKNTEVTKGPSFSLLGESNPHSFYSALSEDMIAEGLLPRFLMVEYTGKRPALNKQYQTINPPIPLVTSLADLAGHCKTLIHHQKIINIQLDKDADKLSDDFEGFATNKINETSNEVILQLWNRAHLKALKLAGLVAVGVHPYEPIITHAHLMWAIDLVQSDIQNLIKRFEIGEVGVNTSENKQQTEVIRMIKDYVIKPWDDISKYVGKSDNNHARKLMYDNRVIPYSYIQKRCILLAAFRNDKIGATNSLKRTLQVLTESDKIREVGRQELAQRYGTVQRAFIVSDLDLIS